VIGALVSYLVRRWAGKVLGAAAIGLFLWALFGHPSLGDALALWVLWLVLAVTHALGFDLFDPEAEQ
jgi:hypothetical protein